MTGTRVEKHFIKKSNPFFQMLDQFCLNAKNLYNHANYVVRQEFTQNQRWIRYGDLDKILKKDTEYPDYKNMPTAQSAQQILRLLDKNWKSFFVSIKDWKSHPEKYQGCPKLPKYQPKTGRNILILTNQNVKLKQDGLLHFPKVFQGFTIKPVFTEKNNFQSFQQIRFLPKKHGIMIEAVYTICIADQKQETDRYIGVDIGVNNLAAVSNNFGEKAVLLNGRPVKSWNQYYNKQISHYREIAKRMNKRDYTARMDRLTEKRNRKIEDYLHKASREVIRYCQKHQISKIVIGHNKEWKVKSSLSKKVNQDFVQIPHMRFIEMIEYKANEYGIEVILTEESYTSGTSFIDNELPVKTDYNKARRRHRGLFVSNDGIKINADLNGAYQILRKVFPEFRWDRGCALHPVIVSI